MIGCECVLRTLELEDEAAEAARRDGCSPTTTSSASARSANSSRRCTSTRPSPVPPSASVPAWRSEASRKYRRNRTWAARSLSFASRRRTRPSCEKIVKVLMDQVERGIDFQGNAYSLFQTAIVLEDKVRERTRTAGDGAARAGEDQPRPDQRQAADRDRADAADGGGRKHLGRLRPVRQRRPADPLQHQVPRILVGPASTRWCAAASPSRSCRAGRSPRNWSSTSTTIRTTGCATACTVTATRPIRSSSACSSGRWLQIRERQTRDGGIVGIYTDITEIKLGEQRRREQELAEKSVLLQSTLDNLAQGVSVFDRHGKLVAWNDRFVDLLELPDWLVRRGASLDDYMQFRSERGDYGRDARTRRWHSMRSAGTSRRRAEQSARQRHRPRGAARPDAGRRLRHHLHRHHRAQARRPNSCRRRRRAWSGGWSSAPPSSPS